MKKHLNQKSISPPFRRNLQRASRGQQIYSVPEVYEDEDNNRLAMKQY